MTGTDTLGARPFAEIARGPLASVYKAYDAEAGAVVLLKTLRPSAAADGGRRERFAQEARLAASVDHPNVVRVLRVADDGSALVAEWVEGRDLQTFLDARGALAPGLAAAVAREAARGLAAVHAAGIVHRDVKPANILLGDDGAVRLTDFGLASLAPDAASAGGEVRGTLALLAPEVVAGAPARPAADVFALGAVLAQMLTGRAPFDAATASDTLDAVLHADAGTALAADPRVPAPLARIAAEALRREPSARPDASALGEALDALLAPGADAARIAACVADPDAPALSLRDVAPAAPALATTAPPVRARRRRRLAPAVGLAGVAALGVLVAMLVRPSPGPNPTEPRPRPVAIETAPSSDPSAEATRLPVRPELAEAPPDDDPDPTPTLPEPASPRVATETEPPAADAAPDRTPTAPAAPPSQPTPAVASPVPEPAPPDAATGTLVVAAEPWATVRVGDRALGTTPVRTTLPAGSHRVTFDHPDFPSHTRTVEVRPDRTTQSELSLWSLVARVTLDVAPWAEVWVDGALWDTVPPQSRPLVLAPGAHALRFEHPTLGRREQTLRVAAGEVRTVRVRMTDPTP